jgi:hypothetical protein
MFEMDFFDRAALAALRTFVRAALRCFSVAMLPPCSLNDPVPTRARAYATSQVKRSLALLDQDPATLGELTVLGEVCLETSGRAAVHPLGDGDAAS